MPCLRERRKREGGREGEREGERGITWICRPIWCTILMWHHITLPPSHITLTTSHHPPPSHITLTTSHHPPPLPHHTQQITSPSPLPHHTHQDDSFHGLLPKSRDHLSIVNSGTLWRQHPAVGIIGQWDCVQPHQWCGHTHSPNTWGRTTLTYRLISANFKHYSSTALAVVHVSFILGLLIELPFNNHHTV